MRSVVPLAPQPLLLAVHFFSAYFAAGAPASAVEDFVPGAVSGTSSIEAVGSVPAAARSHDPGAAAPAVPATFDHAADRTASPPVA